MINPKEFPNSPGVYFIEAPDTGEGYLGSTGDAKRRMEDHLLALRKGQHKSVGLQSAFDRLSGELKVTVCPVATKHEAKEAEQANLDEHMPKGILFNISSDASAPWTGRKRVFTDEERRKLSEASKGVPKSDAHRASLSQAKLGVPQNPQQVARRAVKLQRPVTIDGSDYPSSKHAAAALGITKSMVARRLNDPSYPGWKRVAKNGAP